MKCVKAADGKITRVPDDKAHDMVKGGKHSYTSKTEWRKARNRDKAGESAVIE